MNPKDLIPSRRPDGLIELLHPYTGEVVCVQAQPNDLLKRKSETMVAVSMPNGDMIWLDRNLDPGILGSTGKKRWEFSETLIGIICERIRSGEGLAAICRDPGMPPYQVVCKWRRERKDVDEAIVQARADRAETLKEEALIEADRVVREADSEDLVAAGKLKIETMRWVAGVDNPSRFGQAKKDGIMVGSAVIMIDTGIKRDPPRDVGGSSDSSQKDVNLLGDNNSPNTGSSGNPAASVGGVQRTEPDINSGPGNK